MFGNYCGVKAKKKKPSECHYGKINILILCYISFLCYCFIFANHSIHIKKLGNGNEIRSVGSGCLISFTVICMKSNEVYSHCLYLFVFIKILHNIRSNAIILVLGVINWPLLNFKKCKTQV